MMSMLLLIRYIMTILYISGYNNFPSKHHYWGDNKKHIAVSQSMRRDKFLQIRRFFTILVLKKLTISIKFEKYVIS